MTDLNKRAAAYLELASKATRGPWLVGERELGPDADWEHTCIDVPGHHGAIEVNTTGGGWDEVDYAQQAADAAFIAASHEAAAIIREQRSENDRLRGLLREALPVLRVSKQALAARVEAELGEPK